MRSLLIIKQIFVILCLLIPVSSAAQSENVYSVGVVPQFEAKKLRKIWLPILDELEKLTGYQLKLKASPNINEFEKEFLAGEFDFAYMNPYHLLIANESQGYIPLIRDNGKKLFGILTVRKDSKIKSVRDLNNQLVAFPSPNALGASLQMRAELQDIFKINIKPLYVKTHDSVYLNVLLKQTAAGGGVQKTFNRQQKNIKDALKIIHKTTPVAAHPLAVHPRIKKNVYLKIKQAFLQLAVTEKGRKLIEKIPMRKAGPASLNDYSSLYKMNLKRFFVAD